ncbi:hypothetical protein [Parapedobacter koreensis]|nr:hypothetical protein [Parapedobacter koreensis]
MKNENLMLILTGLMITLGLCALIYVANDIIPEGQKFNSEIWGNINDWMIYGLTLVTAVFLYKTLRSQMEVQKTQNELFKIESTRFKESIKPLLKYSASTDKMIPGEKHKKILTVEVTNETENIALKISRILSQDERSKQIFIPMSLDDRRDHLKKGDNPLLFHFLIDSKSPASEWTVFELNYEDISGNKYKQRVICICDRFGIEINPYLPEIV